jgi:hypothetical protein
MGEKISKLPTKISETSTARKSAKPELQENQRNQYCKKISETSIARKSVVLFPFQTVIFQYFTRSTVTGKWQAACTV